VPGDRLGDQVLVSDHADADERFFAQSERQFLTAAALSSAAWRKP